jgi:hypothetical protein
VNKIMDPINPGVPPPPGGPGTVPPPPPPMGGVPPPPGGPPPHEEILERLAKLEEKVAAIAAKVGV